MTPEEQRKHLEAELATCLKVLAVSDDLSDRRPSTRPGNNLGNFWTEEFTARGLSLRDLPYHVPDEREPSYPATGAVGIVAQLAALALDLQHNVDKQLGAEAGGVGEAVGRLAVRMGRWLIDLEYAPPPSAEEGGELRVVEGGGHG